MNTPSVKDIVVINTNGSWRTKSGGVLSVLLKLDYPLVEKFLLYNEELSLIKKDIRGLRSYVVENIPRGQVGANEWHKVRNEIVFCLRGSIRWSCKDTFGQEVEYIITQDTAVFTPHHILHTYEALEENSSVGVLANTLFFADDPATHDTFSADTF